MNHAPNTPKTVAMIVAEAAVEAEVDLAAAATVVAAAEVVAQAAPLADVQHLVVVEAAVLAHKATGPAQAETAVAVVPQEVVMIEANAVDLMWMIVRKSQAE